MWASDVFAIPWSFHYHDRDQMIYKSAARPELYLICGRFKEKNRTAQKRYRERQKSKLQDSEEKVAELTEQLNALKVEKVCVA